MRHSRGVAAARRHNLPAETAARCYDFLSAAVAPRYNRSMTFKDKVLYHQVHPAKLGTDVAAAIISLLFFWRHDLLVGILTHFIPPPIASLAVMRFADLEPYANSRLGAYLSRYMTRAAEGFRLGGDLITVFAAWYHSPVGIAAGIALILAAWTYGLMPRWKRG
jgi:hypothetical protein